jgi:SAM-dependent methyltransferase
VTAHRSSCLVCGSGDLRLLADLPAVPVLCNQIIRDPAAARSVKRAPLRLVGCYGCGHMFNAAFDPAVIDYDAAYENSLLCSPRYRNFTDEIVTRIRTRCGDDARSVVEIGCGRGEFLRILSESGYSEATGFDPGRPDETLSSPDGARIAIVGEAFDPVRTPQADLVCSRHVLEHLSDPVGLLRQVRTAYAGRPPRLVFLEVPNGSFTLSRLGIWDLIYEHVSYFTRWSLSRAMTEAGLYPLAVEPVFGEQFLVAEARLAGAADPEPPPSAIVEDFMTFGRRFDRMIGEWRAWLQAARAGGRRLAVWGAGSKGVTFLNLLDRDVERAVSYVVDANPLKAGAYVAGTGHPIRPPDDVTRERPDAILLMNPEYEREIRQTLTDLGTNIDCIVVSGELPPSSSAARRAGKRIQGNRVRGWRSPSPPLRSGRG